NAGQGSSSILHPVLSQAHKMFTLSDLEDLPVDIDKDGNSFITLSEEQMDLLSAVHCNLIAVGIEEDILLNLGSDADIDGDWNTGVFKDNFRGVWPMLDGHPVYIEITAEEDDYNLYSVPIKLNGEECNLQVSYSYTDEKYHILGARKIIEDNGMGSRKLVRLKKGDKITTIHYVMTISGDDDEYTPVDVDTFTIGSQPKMEDEDLGDGDYFYYFEFISPTGNSATSKLVEFTVENGHIFTSVDD
ncbi:MAG: clostripain, partial [Selenomonadaceae bacterium]|nr:clostripain [Selenomonadaceae bacterium]